MAIHLTADASKVDSTFHTLCFVMLAGHFWKRCFEVLFIHKYSGGMNLLTCVCISIGYAAVRMMIWCDFIRKQQQKPAMVLAAREERSESEQAVNIASIDYRE